VVGLELGFKEGSPWPDARFVELGVGCESCHGPGAAHAGDPKLPIVNPAKLPPRRAFAICASCHARGWAGPEQGSPVRVEYPIAFRPGDDDIHRSFEFSKPLEGLTTWAFWGNKRARQHHQQANDFERSAHYQKAGMSCASCHESHGRQRYGSLRAEPRDNTLCLQCHQDRSTPERLAAHTHHAPDSTGSVCIACHMPKVVTHANPRELRSHTFWRPHPEIDHRLRVPEACAGCHADRPREWAAEQLDRWRFGDLPRPAERQ
jgi:predicted CXXCH cytochrome family protein